MPEHIHLLARDDTEDAARMRMASVVSALSRSHNPGAANVFAPASAKGIFTERDKLARQVRYIALNPCRAGYVGCPLEWVWTTHRDVMGAVDDPWISEERMVRVLGQSSEAHHRYVSADPSSHVAGTPPPRLHDGDPRRYSIDDALAAAIAGVRGQLGDITRPGPAREQFFALARRAEWRARCLSSLCRLEVKTIHKYLRRAGTPTAATLRCLGTPRLTSYLSRAERAGDEFGG